MEERVKIKHDGPRGWAGIVKSAYDPAVHELYEEPGAEDAAKRTPRKAKAEKPARPLPPVPDLPPPASKSKPLSRKEIVARAEKLGIDGHYTMSTQRLLKAVEEAEKEDKK